MKSIFVAFLLFVTSSSGQSIGCTYSLFPVYTCTLSIDNPNGLDNFLSIPGTHASGRSNADVVRVINAYGNTLNIPEVICRQFQNLQEFQFDNSSIEVLTDAAFRNCPKLKQAIVVRNSISSLSANLFDGAPSLEVIHLSQNSIEDIASGIFDSLANLKTLYLNENPQIEIPLELFENSPNLEILQLVRCGIEQLQHRWFENLTKLRILYLQDNEIENFPDGIFANSPNLLEVGAQRNKLSEIRAKSFADKLEVLNRVLFHNNQIAKIDPLFFDNAPRLQLALFADNICVSRNVSQFSLDRDANLLHFIDCFEAFSLPSAKCRLFDHPDYGYTCELYNVTYSYASRTFVIETEHEGTIVNDEDVKGLIFTTSSLEKIPPSVFETFKNLEYLQVRQSGLSKIFNGTFEGCVTSLKFIDASYNCIKEVEGNSFTECPNVADIRLNHNCIYSIQPCKTFFVDKLSQLTSLNVRQNVCVDGSYEGINLTVKEKMKEDMKGCFGMWFDERVEL